MPQKQGRQDKTAQSIVLQNYELRDLVAHARRAYRWRLREQSPAKNPEIVFDYIEIEEEGKSPFYGLAVTFQGMGEDEMGEVGALLIATSILSSIRALDEVRIETIDHDTGEWSSWVYENERQAFEGPYPSYPRHSI